MYIHGCVATNEDLIFGHNKTSEKLLKEWDENKYSEEELATLIEAANEIAVLYKDVNEIIRKNASFWKKIQNIKRIHVWGLSLSEIDVPYIKHINSIINSKDVSWEFSWYSDSDKKRIVEIITNIGITQYSLVKLEDLICITHKQLQLFDY